VEFAELWHTRVPDFWP